MVKGVAQSLPLAEGEHLHMVISPLSHVISP